MSENQDSVTRGVRGGAARDSAVAKPGIVSLLRKARLQQRLFGGEVEPVKIDRYVVLESLGSGSMGQVFAVYDDQLDRKVALKLVHAAANNSLDGSYRAQRRLHAEARALARLSHPNVVHVYEVGAHEDQVFIAMEFVRGVTLSKWLEGLAARARGREYWVAVIRQFTAAGRGLVAAHSAGVVHRDFKPDNVLVGDDGRLRVVDFGLAHAELGDAANADDAADIASADSQVAAGLSDTRLKSALSASRSYLVGTPRYMSLEQLRGHTADARSDQFSFCVALYRALYRVWPYEGRSIEELARSLERGEVSPPDGDGDVPASVRKALLRGLLADPAHRFPSMDALLDALTVEPPRRWYQTLAAMLVAIAATSGALVYGLQQCATNPCAAVDAPMLALWDEPQETMLGDVFARTGAAGADAAWRSTAAQIDAYAARWREARVDACEATHVRGEQSEALLDRRMGCLDERQFELRAALRTLADIDAASLDKAPEMIAALPDVSVCVRPSELPAVPAAQADALRAIQDDVARANSLARLGKHEQSRALAEVAAERAERVGYAPTQARALQALGWVDLHFGDPAQQRQGAARMHQAIVLAEGVGDDAAVADSLYQLTLWAYNDPDFARGHELAARGVAKAARLGNPPLLHAQALRGRGLMRHRDGTGDSLAQAVADLERALRILPEAISPLVRAPFRLSLANAVRKAGQKDRAEALYRQALDELEGAGSGPLSIADVRIDLAGLERDQGNFDAAVELAEQALRSYVRTLGPDHALVGRARLVLSNIEQTRGAIPAAYEHVAEALRIARVTQPDEPLVHAMLEEQRAALAFMAGDKAQAQAGYERALEILRQQPTPPMDRVMTLKLNLAELFLTLERADEALVLLDEVERARAAGHHIDAVYVAFMDSLRAQALLAEGRYAEAVPLLRAAVDDFAAGRPVEKAAALWALAQALDGMGQHKQAKARALEADALLARRGEDAAEQRAKIQRWLGLRQ